VRNTEARAAAVVNADASVKEGALTTFGLSSRKGQPGAKYRQLQGCEHREQLDTLQQLNRELRSLRWRQRYAAVSYDLARARNNLWRLFHNRRALLVLYMNFIVVVFTGVGAEWVIGHVQTPLRKTLFLSIALHFAFWGLWLVIVFIQGLIFRECWIGLVPPAPPTVPSAQKSEQARNQYDDILAQTSASEEKVAYQTSRIRFAEVASAVLDLKGAQRRKDHVRLILEFLPETSTSVEDSREAKWHREFMTEFL